MSAARKAYRRLQPALRATVRTELLELRTKHGCLTRPDVCAKAAQLGVAERTVWRLAQELDDKGAPTGRTERFKLTDDHLAVIGATPNLRAAWTELRKSGHTVPGYVQWTRACRDADPAVLAGIRFGREALHEKQAYLLVESERRNAVWWIDHYYVPVKCQWRGYRNPLNPVMTTIMDDKSRAIIASVLWPKPPTDAESAAVVAKAVAGFTADGGGFVGGIPEVFRMDRSAELIGTVMTDRLLAMRIHPEPVRPRAGWEKGKLERWHLTLGLECWAVEAGWTGGPKNYDGKPMLTVSNGELPTDDVLRAHLAEWVEHYNTQREHDGLDGRKPLEVYLADQHPIRRCPDDLVRQAMLTITRKVRKEGVRHLDEPYTHPELTQHRDRTVTVAYLPDEPNFVDVELSTGWVRAKRHADLTVQDKDDLMRLRAEQERAATAITRAGKAARATRAAERDPAPEAAVATPTEDKPLGRKATKARAKTQAGVPALAVADNITVADMVGTPVVRRTGTDAS